MEELMKNLNDLNGEIRDLEIQIEKAKEKAEGNVQPLNDELNQVRRDKSRFAAKNDFDSIQDCRRKEENLKFKINAQWNEYALLKSRLTELNREKTDLEYEIQLERDRIKRDEEIRNQIDLVLENYRKTQNIRDAAIASNINPDSAEQWLEWGRSGFNERYSYFYTQIIEIDEHFKDLEAQKLKDQMDSVVEAYKKTGSLKEAAEIAGVSHDTVQYWQEWGSRGFGEENTYFYRKLKSVKR